VAWLGLAGGFGWRVSIAGVVGSVGTVRMGEHSEGLAGVGGHCG
jgi:hypothetical protein